MKKKKSINKEKQPELNINVEDALLALFKTHMNDYISGEEVSASLGISRAGIWKHIENLRNQGYVVEAIPHMGYRLTSIPDKLLPAEIKWKLRSELFNKEIYAYEATESTNDVAYKLAANNTAEGVVVVAETQSKGRGRMGREWASPKGVGIYLSCILRPGILPNEAPKITLLAAVSVAHAIRRETGLPALIKWPNDILIDGGKVAGILTEMKAEQDRCDFIILGIGVNVNTKKTALPKGASSLKEELGERVSRVELVKKILEEIERYYRLFKKEDFTPIRSEWRNLSAILSHRVKVILPDRKIEGDALDVDDGGALIIRLDNGFRERILSGDIIMAREA